MPCSCAVAAAALLLGLAAWPVSDSTGAGCSGSGWPSTVGSIQADSLPSL